jgi:PncC family amidohydrolase
VKAAELGVSSDAIARHGAVSEPVAVAMATGIRERLRAEIGVAITGIAGPSGGSDEKPVGTVHIAVAAPGGVVVRRFQFPGDREMVRRFSTSAALDLIRGVVAAP